jgi:hypothetical protein
MHYASVQYRPAKTLLVGVALFAAVPALATAQEAADEAGTPNVEVISNLRLQDGLQISYTDIELEQDPDRPYAYLARVLGPTMGVDIVSLERPESPEVIYQWRIEDAELHMPLGGMDTKYFKHDGRYYLIQSFQFAAGPDADLGAVVLDVTGLPDASAVQEVGRIRAPDTPGGFHNVFAYKHSSGKPLLVTTTNGPRANVYDLEAFLAGAEDYGLISQIPWPSTAPDRTPYGALEGYHDFYVAYDPGSDRDLVYGSGFNGYYIYDITDPTSPELATSIVGVMGVQLAHTLTATPDAKIGVGQTEYRYSPVRIYDLEPGLSGERQTISSEVSAWTRNYEALSHNNELRYPYVFVTSYKDGLDIFDISDPENPKSVGHYDTYHGPEKAGLALDMGMSGSPVGESDFNGAFGVDVRNYDGLVAVSDMETGLWIFHVDGFDGWNGADWGMPNISSVQDWDNGPKVLVP